MESTGTGEGMFTSRFEFRSRIGARAVGAGAIVTLTLAGVLMLLGGGFGLMPSGPITAESLHHMGAGVGLWSGISWVIAAYVGGYLASVISRSMSRRDGALHGVVTWAVASTFTGFLAWARIIAALAVGLVTTDAVEAMRSPAMFLGLFFFCALSLFAALFGGVAGARSEYKAATREPLEARPGTERFPGRPPTPQPA
jgi:hypothetical protein